MDANFFEKFRKFLLYFLKFWDNDELAVRLAGIASVIILMVLFCCVKYTQRLKGGDDWLSFGTRSIEFFNKLLSLGLLCFVCVEDRRAVLRPHVVSLAV